MTSLLDKINSPADLKKLSVPELSSLAQEIREFMTQCIAVNGGHLASNLGVVELTLAMHYVFDFKTDKLLWDVGHQCYTHKIITGRKELFTKLRTRQGISGFPNPDESPYDQFTVGHAGTAIGSAIGLALGSKQMSINNKILALVGDASIVNGLSFEALNNLGLVKRQLLVVLNDNSMAIDTTQGAMARYLSKVRLSHTYDDLRTTAAHVMENLPLFGRTFEDAVERLKKTVRMSAVSASQLFESLNIHYFGPIDGHDIPAMVELFSALSKLDHPALLHVYTKKGKGFTPADNDPRKFHSTGPFKINGESAASLSSSKRSYTDAFGDALTDLAAKNSNIVAITAAMCDGTGLTKFRQAFPDRCIDVGIAESAAVNIASGLAKTGIKPFVCMYSTFLQRSFDQVFQEVCLASVPVVFCIDRAGLVGGDGATHHGLLDIAMLRALPGMVLLAPACEAEFRYALEFAATSDHPVAIRYPRDSVPSDPALDCCAQPFQLGKSIPVVQADSKIALVAYGNLLSETLAASRLLAAENIPVSVINARFAKPIDPAIIELAKQGKKIVTVEEHSTSGGFGSALLQELSAARISADVTVLGTPDSFIAQGSRSEQLDQCGISAKKIAQILKTLL